MMKLAGSWKTALSAVLLIGVQVGCGPQDEVPASETESSVQGVETVTAPNPPPASCDQRSKGVTGIQVLVRIDQYQGLITGKNGTHEIAYGTITETPWVFDKKIVDTTNTQLALNVKSSTDPSGLPHEIKLAVGQVVEVEGEFIPKSTANAHDSKGAAAVIHFTHTPCGYITIAGTTYH